MTASAFRFIVLLGMLLTLTGCAAKTQWWRVGSCLVLFENQTDERQVIVVGKSCEIKRDTLTAQGRLK
jgi:hypothetical protein